MAPERPGGRAACSAAGGCAAEGLPGSAAASRRSSAGSFAAKRIPAMRVVSMGAAMEDERMSRFLAGIAALTLAGAAIMPIQAGAAERAAGASTANAASNRPKSARSAATGAIAMATTARAATGVRATAITAIRTTPTATAIRTAITGPAPFIGVRLRSVRVQGVLDQRLTSTRARRRTCPRSRRLPPSRARRGGCGPCSPAGPRSCGSRSRRSARRA